MNTATFSLTATERPKKKNSARDSRKQDLVPGVVYGYKFEPLSVSIPYSDLLRTYRQAGESALIDLTVGKKNVKVLIHRLSLHPVTRALYHFDLYVVNLKEKTDIPVPLEFVGESPAVKDQEGVLVKEYETILLRCLPSEIPQSIEVPLNKLEELNDSITVEMLDIDFEKYEIMDLSQDSVVATVFAPQLATEEEEEEDEESLEGEEGEEGEEREGGEEKSEDGDKKSAEEKKE